jgi:hypothetical protein
MLFFRLNVLAMFIQSVHIEQKMNTLWEGCNPHLNASPQKILDRFWWKLVLVNWTKSCESNLVLLYWLGTTPILQEAQIQHIKFIKKKSIIQKTFWTALMPITFIWNVFWYSECLIHFFILQCDIYCEIGFQQWICIQGEFSMPLNFLLCSATQ